MPDTTAETLSPTASATEDAGRTSTLFGAANIPRLGEAVLAVHVELDAVHATPDALTLRLFLASAPGRGALARREESAFLASEGALAYLALDLRGIGSTFSTDLAVDRTSRLTRAVLHDSIITGAEITRRRVFEWLMTTTTVHLNLGSFSALEGDARAFGILADAGTVNTSTDDAFAVWGRSWIESNAATMSTDAPVSFTIALAASATGGDSRDVAVARTVEQLDDQR